MLQCYCRPNIDGRQSPHEFIRYERNKICLIGDWFCHFLLRPFLYLGSTHRVFNLHVLRSCVSSIFTPFSFMSFLVTSLHLSFGLPIFRCSPTSMFSLLYLLQSFSSHGLTISVLLVLFFSLMFSTTAPAIISPFLNFSILLFPSSISTFSFSFLSSFVLFTRQQICYCNNWCYETRVLQLQRGRVAVCISNWSSRIDKTHNSTR